MVFFVTKLYKNYIVLFKLNEKTKLKKVKKWIDVRFFPQIYDISKEFYANHK
jgi:hypothetical protein